MAANSVGNLTPDGTLATPVPAQTPSSFRGGRGARGTPDVTATPPAMAANGAPAAQQQQAAGVMGGMAQSSDARVSEAVRRSFLNFLDNFTLSDNNVNARDSQNGSQSLEGASEGRGGIRRPYVEQAAIMAEQNRASLCVNYEHLASWDATLATEVVEAQYYRFEQALRQAVGAFMQQHQPAFAGSPAAV
eukprot:CAMPEP_0197493606 /NCGR_PEP_ID=MMETSP1311-20131121/23316_1 /TAXON_ID=464262 /ORGANISM="Genus nov. species nov., Strain RCC856" /LENGTH=189 /DNA_ID=CAMNT_0043038881 /DNA_START=176 /DNA_END=742 /DNA_ORIENTATION=+